MRIVCGFQDTRSNKEDFALTPYLFPVIYQGNPIRVYGIGICWGWYSIYVGIGFNIPENYPSFRIIDKNYKHKE